MKALLTVPAELSELYAFHYISPDIPDRQHGWNLYDIRSEYLRMGVCSENWTLTNINREYEVRGLCKVIFFTKIRVFYVSGWVGPDLTWNLNFCVENHLKIALNQCLYVGVVYNVYSVCILC